MDSVYEKFDPILFTEDPNVNNEECIICKIDHAPPKTKLKGCACKKFVHKQCVYRWIQRKRECPHCNVDLISSEDWMQYFYSDEARDDLDDWIDPDSQDDWGEIPSWLNHPETSNVDPMRSFTMVPMPLQQMLFYAHIMKYIESNYDELESVFFHKEGETVALQSQGVPSSTILPADDHQPQLGPSQ